MDTRTLGRIGLSLALSTVKSISYQSFPRLPTLSLSQFLVQLVANRWLDPRAKWGSIEMYLDQSLLNHVCLSPIQDEFMMAPLNYRQPQATGCLTISRYLRISVLFRLFLWRIFVSPLGLVLALSTDFLASRPPRNFLFFYQPAFLRSW